MAEQTWQDRYDKMEERQNKLFARLDVLLQAFCQTHNLSLSSIHGAGNSSKEMVQPRQLQKDIDALESTNDAFPASELMDVVASESYTEEITTSSLQEDIDASEMMNANLPSSELLHGVSEAWNEDCTESNKFFPYTEHQTSRIGVTKAEILDRPKSHNVPIDTIADAITTDRGLSLKFLMPFDLDIASLLISQARIRQLIYSDAYFDERKIVLVSVYGNLKVDITGIQQDSRFVPPDNLVVCCASENLGKDECTSTTCFKKCMYERFNYMASYVHCTGYTDEQQEGSLSKMSYSRHLESLSKDRFTLARYEIGTIAMGEVVDPEWGIKFNYSDNVTGVTKGKQRYSKTSLVANRFLSLTGCMHDIASDFPIRKCIDWYNCVAIVSKSGLPQQRRDLVIKPAVFDTPARLPPLKPPDWNLDEVSHSLPLPMPLEQLCLRFYSTKLYHPCHILNCVSILDHFHAYGCKNSMFQFNVAQETSTTKQYAHRCFEHCSPKFDFIVSGINDTQMDFHAIGQPVSGITVAIEHQVGIANRLGQSSMLADLKAFDKGFGGFAAGTFLLESAHTILQYDVLTAKILFKFVQSSWAPVDMLCLQFWYLRVLVIITWHLTPHLVEVAVTSIFMNKNTRFSMLLVPITVVNISVDMILVTHALTYNFAYKKTSHACVFHVWVDGYDTQVFFQWRDLVSGPLEFNNILRCIRGKQMRNHEVGILGLVEHAINLLGIAENLQRIEHLVRVLISMFYMSESGPWDLVDNLGTNHFAHVYGSGFGVWIWYKSQQSGAYSIVLSNIPRLFHYMKPLTHRNGNLWERKNVITQYAREHTFHYQIAIRWQEKIVSWAVGFEDLRSFIIKLLEDSATDEAPFVGEDLNNNKVLQSHIADATFDLACEDDSGLSATMFIIVKCQVKSFQLFEYARADTKWDSGGNEHYVHNNGSLSFKQWDPGGGSLAIILLSPSLLRKLLLSSNCYLGFNLEDKVGFKGGR